MLPSSAPLNKPEFVRYVSVYTGPALYADLRDEYSEARRRLMEGKNAVIMKEEDIQREQRYVKTIQLHSHLLFKVVVHFKHLPEKVILRAAAHIAWGCLNARTPQRLTMPKLIRTYPSDGLARRSRGNMKYIVRVEFGSHPLFKCQAKPTTKVMSEDWTPRNVDEQYARYLESCAENAESRESRHRRIRTAGASIHFRRNSMGETEILI